MPAPSQRALLSLGLTRTPCVGALPGGRGRCSSGFRSRATLRHEALPSASGDSSSSTPVPGAAIWRQPACPCRAYPPWPKMAAVPPSTAGGAPWRPGPAQPTQTDRVGAQRAPVSGPIQSPSAPLVSPEVSLSPMASPSPSLVTTPTPASPRPYPRSTGPEIASRLDPGRSSSRWTGWPRTTTAGRDYAAKPDPEGRRVAPGSGRFSLARPAGELGARQPGPSARSLPAALECDHPRTGARPQRGKIRRGQRSVKDPELRLSGRARGYARAPPPRRCDRSSDPRADNWRCPGRHARSGPGARRR